jgi:hypothetical protein
VLKSVYLGLLEILFFSTDGGRSDLVVFNELAEAVLGVGTSAAEYRDLVSFASNIWNRFAAPTTLDWAVDTLDLLLASPCADAGARQSFLQAVLDRAAGFSRRLTADQRDVLRLTSSDLGAGNLAESYFPAEGVPTDETTDPISALGQSSVAVYTLTVRAAEQFRRVVQARAPNASVTILHDLDASRRLEQHARHADLFILVTASAKHAATDCVRAYRPPGKPLLMPAGKGAASMLAAVRGHLALGG